MIIKIYRPVKTTLRVHTAHSRHTFEGFLHSKYMYKKLQFVKMAVKSIM